MTKKRELRKHVERERGERERTMRMDIERTRTRRGKDNRRVVENENGEQFPIWNVVYTNVVCAVCGKELGDVPATMPVPDTCDRCLAAFASWAAERTPAEVLEARMNGTVTKKIKKGRE